MHESKIFCACPNENHDADDPLALHLMDIPVPFVSDSRRPIDITIEMVMVMVMLMVM